MTRFSFEVVESGCEYDPKSIGGAAADSDV
jgi:hypothetical protein